MIRGEAVTLKVGQKFGHFLIEDLLQKGGMGEVYSALDRNTNEVVALKLLTSRYIDNAYVKNRFLAEGEVYRRLSHPNIVRYIDSGEIDSQFFIALEHIQGIDLGQLIERDGPCEIDLALSIMLDVTYAVNFAHSKDIIHRDLKPHNIMISQDKVIKLIDFGVAHAKNSYVVTDAGMVVGSLCYNSPEQNQGKIVDVRGDIYSLGLVFYEIITGKRLLPNTSVSDIILSQVELDHTIIRPRFITPKCPEALQTLILKMCRFEKRERHKTLEIVLLELKEIIRARKGGGSTSSAFTKALADKDLADTHYWKGMNLLAEGKYIGALDEFEALLNLSLFQNQAYISQVEEQVDFLSWTLELCCEGATSEEDEIKSVELDVLQKLSSEYSTPKPAKGIKNAMRSLLGLYKEKLEAIKKRRKKEAKARKAPIAPEVYPLVINKLGSIYAKLGHHEQQRLMTNKIVNFAKSMEDSIKAKEIMDNLARDLAGNHDFQMTYIRFLFKKGFRESGLQKALEQGLQLRKSESFSKAFAVFNEILKYDEDNKEAGSAIEELHKQINEVAEESKKLLQLTRRMVDVQDYSSAINMCIKFLHTSPENRAIQMKLAELYVASGAKDEAYELFKSLGISAYNTPDYEEAKLLFARAIEIKPNSKASMNYLVDIIKMEDPSICTNTSHKAIIEAIYRHLGMLNQLIDLLRGRLKGSPSDLPLYEKIVGVLEEAGKSEEIIDTKIEQICCAIETGDEEMALAKIDEFATVHTEEGHLQDKLTTVSFESRLRIKNPRLRDLLKS